MQNKMIFQEFIIACNQAKSRQELAAVWQKNMAQAGFDKVLFSLLTDHPVISRKAGHVVAINFPKDWLATYFSEIFILMKRQILSPCSAISWKSLRGELNSKDKHKKFFIEAEEAGIHGGAFILLRGPMGAFASAMVGSSSANAEIDALILDSIRLLSQQFYTSFLKLESKPATENAVSLTEREKEILTRYATGKTNTEIARLLDITPRVVKFHLEGAFRKLGVRNGRVAVLHAVSMGLILPEYEIQENQKIV